MSDLVASHLPPDLRFTDITEAVNAAGLSFTNSINDTQNGSIKYTDATYAGRPYAAPSKPRPQMILYGDWGKN